MNIADMYAGKRIFLFAGHYGSGKSEIAVNFASALAEKHRTAIVDFDIINTYFRAADARAALEQKGVRVITPVYAKTNVDVPALPAEVFALFDDKAVKAVFDVGGDGAGARAVSGYRAEFSAEPTENFFVFNLRRQMTSSAGEIIKYFHDIQRSARLPFTAIINNTNLLAETDEVDLLEGLEAAAALSGVLALPVAFSASMAYGHTARFLSRSRELGIPVFFMEKHIFMEYGN